MPVVTQNNNGLVSKDGFYSRDSLYGIDIDYAPLGTYRINEAINTPSDSPYSSGILACFGSIKDGTRMQIFSRVEGAWIRVNWNGWNSWKKIGG